MKESNNCIITDEAIMNLHLIGKFLFILLLILGMIFFLDRMHLLKIADEQYEFNGVKIDKATFDMISDFSKEKNWTSYQIINLETKTKIIITDIDKISERMICKQ
jgi:hypothetical protein